MNTSDDSAPKESLQSLDAHQEALPSDSGTLIAGESVGVDQLADNDLLSALAPISFETLGTVENLMPSTMSSVSYDGADSIGHTLDQLTTATNLFDVPPLDVGTF
jgi:hypothetical protein